MYKSEISHHGLRSMLLVGAAAIVGFATPALAQQQQQGGVETVVVTGSILNRADVETPSPVTIVTSQQIQASGLTSTADVVRSLADDNSGSIPEAFGIGFAAGSSGVALRGLTVNSTLVLINGRRTANYPLADDGERGFVDLNTIPLDSVDRVEVLQDGASSIYGADAIAGVVNIIMKDEFQGVNANAEYGTSEQGGGTMQRLTTTLGYGDMASDHFNAYVDLEYEKDDAIHASQRDFPFNTNDLSSIGGFDFNPFVGGSTSGVVAPTLLTGAYPTGGADLGPYLNSTAGQLGPTQILNPNGCLRGQIQRTNVDGIDGTFCEQNIARDYGEIAPQTEHYGVYAHAKERFSNAATFYMDASYFENNTTIATEPTTFTATTPHNLGALALPAYLISGARNPNDPFVNNNAACPLTGVEGTTNSVACPDALLAGTLASDTPHQAIENNHVMRATVGLKGDWRGWTYDTAFVAAHAWLDTQNSGFLNYNQLTSDVANGTYNFIDPSMNSPATVAALAPNLVKQSSTDEDSWDIRASHDLFALPGGEAQLGVSLEARHEATFDPDLNPGLNAQGLGIAHTIGNRNIYSASAELGLPLLPTLEADLSGRFDHYSDFGDTFNPKIGLKWTPIPQVGLRGTYSTGFRAPSFSENGSSEAEGFTSITGVGIEQELSGTQLTQMQHFISQHLTAANQPDPYVADPYGFGYISLPNSAIKPEKARNYTLGTILTPFSDIDLNSTVDYYNIEKTSVIEPPSPTQAIPAGFGAGSVPAGYTIIFDAPDPLHPLAPLRPQAISAPYTNGDSEKTSGIDVNVHFGTDLWDGLHWSSDVNYTQIFDFLYTPTAGGPTFNYVGSQAPFELSSSGGTPRDKGNWANTFTWQDLSVTGTLYYTDGFKEYLVDSTGVRQCGGFYPITTGKFCNMNSFWDFDLTARYHVSDTVDLFGGVSNLFNAKAPLDVNDYGAGNTGVGLNYDPTYDQAGAVGRFYTIGVSFRD